MSIEWGDLPVTAAPTLNEWDDTPAGGNDWGDVPSEPSPYSPEALASSGQKLVQTVARARELREQQERELATPKYFVGIRPNLGGIGLPQVGMDKPLVQFQVPEELVAFGGEAVKSSPSAAAGLAAASSAMPASQRAGTAISALPVPFAPAVGTGVRFLAPLAAGGAAAMGVRFAQEEVLPEILPEDMARSYRTAGEAAAGSPASAMLGQFAGTLPFFRPGLPVGTEPASRLTIPAVSGVIGGGIEGAQQAVRGEFDPQQLAIATLGSALLNRETRLGQRVGPNLVLREAQTSALPAELIPVSQAMRESLPGPSLPSPTMSIPTELAPVAAARAEAGAEIASAAAQRAGLEAAESQARIRALGERMMGKSPQDQLQILDQEMRLQKDYLNEAEQRAGLDLKQELKRQIDAQKAMEEAANAQAKAVADTQRSIEAAQRPPEIPESARILAEPITKTPSIANVATEVATQTKNSPYALQERLNQMTTPAVAEVAGGVPPAVVAAEVSPKKTQAIQQAVANPLTKWQYTVFRPGEGYPSAIQVDAIEGTVNTVSSNVADLNAAGAKLPEVPDWVPQGRYSVEEIQAFIKQGEPNAIREQEAAGGVLRREATQPQLDVGLQGMVRENGPETPPRDIVRQEAMQEPLSRSAFARSVMQALGDENALASSPASVREAIEKMPPDLRNAIIEVDNQSRSMTQAREILDDDILKEISAAQKTPKKYAQAVKWLREFSPTPEVSVSTAELRLNDAGIGLPPISSLSAKQKLAELQAGGVTAYKGKPIEDANPAQLSAALGQYRRGQLGSERGSVPTNVLAPIGGAAGGATTGFVSTERQPGESDEEFFTRRMRNTLVGGIVGSGGAVATYSFASNVMNRAKSRAQSLKAIQQEATGREAMPDWYIRLRQTPAGVAVREAINNNRVRIKDLVTNVSKDAKVPEEANPYLTGKLYPGRVSERIRQAEETMRGVQDSIITAAKASGMPEQDFINRFNLWMEARHTPFYNAMLRERHDVPGAEPPRHRFTDEQAADILAETGKDGYAKVFEDLDKELRGVTEATRDMLVSGGIIDEGAVREWRKIYPNYVPFNRIFPEDTAEKAAEIVLGGGPGLNVLGTGVYGIKGSDLPVADISGSIYGNFIDAIRRVEKNRVDLSAVEFFRGPGSGTPGIRVKTPGVMEHFNPNTMVAARKDGQRVWIEFDDPKLATAFSNLNPEAQTGLLKLISYPTRWFSQLVTRFNPNFLAANPLRDRQEAALKLASQGDWEGAAKAINPATTLYKDPKAVVSWMRDTGSPDALLFQQMLDDGGMAGGFASSTKNKAYDIVEEFRTSDVNALVGAKDKFLKFVDVLTDISEGSTRLRAYRRALELGATRQEAALAARNASIDFNQKGTLTPQASALWAFINPATQGPINSAKALIRDPKTLAVIAAGFVGLDAAIDAWNSSYDPEWKKKPSFQFSRTSGIPVIYGVDEKTGELKTFSYPVAHALRPIKAVMDFSSDLAGGQIDADNLDRELARVGGAVVDSTNPLGSSNVKTAWAPSVVRPALESWLNEKFTGSPIVPKWLEADPKIADTAKRFLSSYDTATGRMANQLSDVAYRHGVDVSPERMRYLITQYTGGPGRVVAGLINTSPEVIKAMQKSPDFDGIKASEVPVASAFFRRINPEISERETAEYRDTEEFVRGAKTDEELRRQQARLFYRDYVEAIPAQNRAAFLRDAAQMGAIPDDPVYRNTLVSLLRSGMRDRDATDNLIGTLGVESGERARYYDTRLRAMKTPEERDAFLREQAQRGLLNRTVFSQLQQISGAEN